jgi:glycosyltransferase involved in cell wall biosynthesis
VLGAVRPEILHLHGLDRLGAEVVPALRRLAPGARIVLTLHDYGLICANEGLMLTAGEGARCDGAAPERCRRCFPSIPAVRHALRRDHLQALLRGVDVFIAPGTFVRDRFVEWGLEAGRIVLIPNAVHVPRKGERDKRDRPNRFGFFGNLAPHKGVLVLLEAAARLKRAGSDISVALHGGFGWQPPELRQHVSEAAAEAAPVARLAGPYAREAVSALMAGVDWMVAPSTWCENAPLTVLEARAAGLPVIASGIGGLADLVADGIDGLHVPPADPVALAEVMARVAEDGRLHRRLARASRPAMTYAHHVDAHLDLFRALSRRAVA